MINTSYFKQHGRTLLANGYLIVPIKPGTKRPANGENWQDSRLSVADLNNYMGCGVGILCGQGAYPISAVDIDTKNEMLAESFAQWCRIHLGVGVERVGDSPKLLIVYRAIEQGLGKATGVWLEDRDMVKHRLEILGKGQQFVAYHIHPDTREPYEWVDVLGGPEYIHANELPIISDAQMAEALLEFQKMAEDLGMKPIKGSRPKLGLQTSQMVELDTDSPPIGLSIEDVRRRLEHINNEDYSTWLKVGMSLHHEFDGDADGLNLWNAWSSTASNYSDFADLEYRWHGFSNAGSQVVSARWLLKESRVGQQESMLITKRLALDHAKEKIIECEDSLRLVNEVAHDAGVAAGQDIAIKAELVGLIKARFKKLTGTALSAVDIRIAMSTGVKSIAAPRPKTLRHERTEFGNAKRMLDKFGDGLMYVPNLGWYMWSGVYWKQISEIVLDHLAKETIEALRDEVKLLESDNEQVEFMKHCILSQKSHMVKSMVNLVKSDPRITTFSDMLDTNNYLLGVGNGSVDLRTGLLRPPEKEDRITINTSITYNPEAKCPLFIKTLNDVFFDDNDLVAFFQKLIGYTILGKPDEDVLVIPYGSGSNGKSTVLGAIRDVLGSHAVTASSEMFLTSGVSGSNSGAARPDILALRNARFVYVTEPEEGQELRESLIKAMTGGEKIVARTLYNAEYISMQPTWSIFMPTNHKPIIKGSDLGIWRRLLPVPFLRNFNQDQSVTKDINRAEKLKAEYTGILNWCVQGAILYQKLGLGTPKEIDFAREEYKEEMDLTRDWLIECCETNDSFKSTMSELWESWESWAKKNGMLKYISSQNALSRRLSLRFNRGRMTGGRMYLKGLRPKVFDDLA